MKKSAPQNTPVRTEEARAWFIEHFSACADLDTRLIPDLHAGEKGGMRQLDCPIAFSSKDLDALQKRFSCDADILLTTAFGVTVSVWNADTKAFFPTGGGQRPVLVEWTPDQSLEELIRNRQEKRKYEEGRYYRISCHYFCTIKGLIITHGGVSGDGNHCGAAG